MASKPQDPAAAHSTRGGGGEVSLTLSLENALPAVVDVVALLLALPATDAVALVVSALVVAPALVVDPALVVAPVVSALVVAPALVGPVVPALVVGSGVPKGGVVPLKLGSRHAHNLGSLQFLKVVPPLQQSDISPGSFLSQPHPALLFPGSQKLSPLKKRLAQCGLTRVGLVAGVVGTVVPSNLQMTCASLLGVLPWLRVLKKTSLVTV